MTKPSMRQKFAKKIEQDAIAWLEANRFSYPYTEARNLDCLPKYVISYFKKHKLKTSNDNNIEPGVE